MPQILFQLSDGSEIAVDADVGQSVMRAASARGVPGIDAECGGACSCATCLVHVSPDWFDRVGGPGEVEKDMLEFGGEPTEFSRLSCQIIMIDLLDGVRLKVARD
jgi:ferredoxin, 2Fe-2S